MLAEEIQMEFGVIFPKSMSDVQSASGLVYAENAGDCIVAIAPDPSVVKIGKTFTRGILSEIVPEKIYLTNEEGQG